MPDNFKKMNQQLNIEKLIPKWTKRAFTDPSGRDPLGLSRVANSITDYLLTGIITLTNRARYYSFYCWVLWHIQQTESLSKYNDFVESFKCREAALALATVANNNTSPVGVTAVQPVLERGLAEGEINTKFRVLPSSVLGGYSQYYGGSIYQLGLTHTIEGGFDRVTDGIATDLALAFHDSIRNTPYIKKECFRHNDINAKDFIKSKSRLSLETIKEKAGGSERNLLVELFFGFNLKPIDERALNRKHTLGQILYILNEYNKNEVQPSINEIDTDFVFSPYYYKVLWLNEDLIIPYECPKKFESCRLLWRQFCVQHYFTHALENILFAVIEIISTEPSGLTISEVVNRLIGEIFFNALNEKTNIDCDTPSKLMEYFHLKNIPDQKYSQNMQKEILPTSQYSEIILENILDKHPEEALANSVVMLSILYCKWRGIEDDIGLQYVNNHAGGQLWLGQIFNVIDSWLNKDTSWQETLSSIINQYIVQQHDKVMFEKGNLDSRWINYSEGRIYKEQDYSPRIRSSRHRQSIEILIDLCLVENTSEGLLNITPNGKKILNKVLKG